MWKSNVLACFFVWGRCSMADDRLQLHELLTGITEHAYFQPPSNIKMQYPCIIYKRDNSRTQFAGNKKYMHTKRYQVTVVDRDPDTELPDTVEELPLCTFDRYFAADELNHYVFTLFF
jgi:hypothetical protein